MEKWPASKIERRKIDALIPYARNARTHEAWQVAQIAASMQEWGWTNPILVDDTDMVLAGHARVLAAMKLGYPEVPVIVARGWSEAQKRAYVLTDNRAVIKCGLGYSDVQKRACRTLRVGLRHETIRL